MLKFGSNSPMEGEREVWKIGDLDILRFRSSDIQIFRKRRHVWRLYCGCMLMMVGLRPIWGDRPRRLAVKEGRRLYKANSLRETRQCTRLYRWEIVGYLEKDLCIS